MLEGSVTISLRDYEELKDCDNERQRYLELAVRYVHLFEDIEEFLKGEKIAPGLNERINSVLSEWYG